MATCKMVYLDEFGKPSAFYDRMVEKHGPVKGEELYIKHMMGMSAAQFQMDIDNIPESLQKLNDLQDNIISPDDRPDNKYFNNITKKVRNRTTEWIGGFPVVEVNAFNIEVETEPGDFDTDKISLNVAQSIIKNEIKSVVGNEDIEKTELARLFAKKLKEEPGYLEARAKDIRDQWDAKARYGTFIHNVLEKAFIIRNELERENETLSAIDRHDLNTWNLASKAYFEVLEETRDRGGSEYMSDPTAGFVQSIEAVLDKAASLEKQFKKKFTIMPEARLDSDFLGGHPNSNVPSKQAPGLAGSADLLFISEDGKDVYVGDFKTKDKGTLKNFDRIASDVIGGPFGNLTKNAEGKAEAQMSVYAAMLKEMGFNVLGGSVFILRGKFSPVPNGAPMGEKEWRYTQIDGVQTLPVTIHVGLENAAQRDSMMKHRKLMQEEGAFGMIDSLSDGNVTYGKDNEKAFVRRYKGSMTFEHNGKTLMEDISTGKILTVPKNATDEDLENMAKGVFKRLRAEEAKIAQTIKNYFRRGVLSDGDKESEFSGKIKERVDKLLYGLSKETHEIHIAEEYHSAFADMGPDVLVAVNKETGDITLLSAITNSRNTFEFDGDGKNKRTSIFGKYYTDQQLLAKNFPSSLINDVNVHDFINQKLAIGAMNYRKAVGKAVGIEAIKTASIQSNGIVTATDMTTQLGVLKQFAKIPDARDDMPEHILEMLEDSGGQLSDAREYKEDFLTKIDALLKDHYKIRPKKYKSDIMKVRYSLEEYADNKDSVNELITSLAKYNRHFKTGLGRHYAESQEFQMLNEALLSLLDVDLASKQLRQETLAGTTFGRTAITSGDYYAQKLYTLYNSSSLRIQRDMKKVKRKNEELFSALLESKGISRNAGEAGLKAAFRNMYKDFDMEDISNNQNWMKLKDPEDPKLTKEEKAYIEFFNETTLNAVGKARGGTKGIKEGKTWSKGLVPVYLSTTDLLDKKAYKNGKSFTKVFQVAKKERAINDIKNGDKFEYNSGIEKQLGNSGKQHSEHRRQYLGISRDEDSGKDTKPHEDVEQNLAVIVMHTALEGSMQENMQILADTYGAMDALLTARDAAEDIDSDDSRDLLFMVSEMIIHNRYKKEGDFADHLDKIKKYASQFMFTLSTKQAMLEMTTQAVNSTSATWTQMIKQAAFKDSKFSVEDMGWANKVLLNKFDRETTVKVSTIIEDHNMLIGDPANFRSNEYTEIKKWEVWKSNAMRGMNTIPFNFGIKKIVLAQMKKLGIPDAYENIGTAENPEFVYNENMDVRFHVYDPEKPASSKNVEPKTDEEKRKHASWKHARTKMLKEGSLDENGRMTVPLFAEQRAGMKQYATKLFGSFGKDGIIMANFTSIGRVATTYKGWFAQKLANYYTPTHMSELEGKEVHTLNEETGEYEVSWEGGEVEGIIQSVNKLLKEIDYYNVLKLKGVKLTPAQEDNFSKLLADGILLAFSMLAIWPLLEQDNKFMKSEFGQSMKKSVMNASGELNIFATTNSMLQNVAPVAMVVGGIVKNTFAATMALTTGDVDLGMKTALKGVSKGGIKSIVDITDLMTDN